MQAQGQAQVSSHSAGAPGAQEHRLPTPQRQSSTAEVGTGAQRGKGVQGYFKEVGELCEQGG